MIARKPRGEGVFRSRREADGSPATRDDDGQSRVPQGRHQLPNAKQDDHADQVLGQ